MWAASSGDKGRQQMSSFASCRTGRSQPCVVQLLLQVCQLHAPPEGLTHPSSPLLLLLCCYVCVRATGSMPQMCCLQCCFRRLPRAGCSCWPPGCRPTSCRRQAWPRPRSSLSTPPTWPCWQAACCWGAFWQTSGRQPLSCWPRVQSPSRLGGPPGCSSAWVLQRSPGLRRPCCVC